MSWLNEEHCFGPAVTLQLLNTVPEASTAPMFVLLTNFHLWCRSQLVTVVFYHFTAIRQEEIKFRSSKAELSCVTAVVL